MVEFVQYSGDLQPLIEYVCQGKNRPIEGPDSPEFRKWCQNEWGPDFDLEYYGAGIFPLDEYMDEEWYRGYPHKHTETMGWDSSVRVMIVICQVPEEGGLIGVGGVSPDDEYEFYEPEPGLGYIVDGDTWHGVTPVTKGIRMAVVVVGHPK